MGRTVIPLRRGLETERGGWKEFRKALSKEQQEGFDHIFANRMHAIV